MRTGTERAVVDVLARSSGAPGALALVGGGRAWTYGELGAAVDRRAEELLRVPVARDAVWPVTVSPDPEGVVTLLACWRAGRVPAPLDARLTEPERELATAALADAPRGAQVVLWTSGSAGRPRGVALSYDNLRTSVEAAARRLELSERDVWLASLAPSHVGGLVLAVRSVLLGVCLVAPGSFDAARVSALLDGTDTPPLTHMSLVPTQLRRLLARRAGRPPPSTFRCALIGGAHAPEGLVTEALGAGWPLALTYGMTEACSQVATAPPELVRRKPGTVGPPLEGVEVRVAEDGELRVRGATVALGYLAPPPGSSAAGGANPADASSSGGMKPPDASARAGMGRSGFSASGGASSAPLLPVTDREGWYHTGDYGRVDEDGDLWITGRSAERIVSGGVTVDAVEVEEALRAHPAVVDACVVGVPDEEWGERVGACVVPVWGELDLEELDEHLAARLAPPKRPRSWIVRPSLPLNANGKPDREAVRRLLGGP